MADIHIERRGPGVLPWVIGLLVLALLIWGLVEMFGNEGDAGIVDPMSDTVTAVGGVTTQPAARAPAMAAPLPSDTAAPGVDGSALSIDSSSAVVDP